MNRLFGKNTKKQLLTQHSLLDDNDDDEDDVFSRVEAAFPEYCPPPTSLLPEPLRKPVQTADRDAAVVACPSSPTPKQSLRIGGLGRHQSAQNIGSPTQQAPPLSPPVPTKPASNLRISSPRRFSSPDRIPKFFSVATTATKVNSTKVSMLQSLRDRMKLGTSTNGGTERSTEQASNHVVSMMTATANKILDPPSDLFCTTSIEFSEPFTTCRDDDAITKDVAPASEAFTVRADEMATINDGCDDPATQQRPKLKFSISSEPIQPKLNSTTIKALTSHGATNKDEKPNETEEDAKNACSVSNISNDTSTKQRATKAIRASRKKAIEKRPKTPTNELHADINIVPKTPPADSAKKEEQESIDCDHDKKVPPTKTPSIGLTKTISKTPNKTSHSEKDVDALSNDIPNDDLVISHDKVNSTIDTSSCQRKSTRKDYAPQTPKRTYSSDDEAQFLVDETTAAPSGNDDVAEKKIATKNSRPSASTNAPKTPKKDDGKAAEDATSKIKSKESLKSKSKSKSPKTPTKDSSSKKKKNATALDNVVTPKSSSKKGSSTLKSKESKRATNTSKDEKQSASNNKKPSTSKKPKRRNSTNTILASDDNDDDDKNNNSSIPIIGNKWLGIIDTKEMASNLQAEAVPKRRNSCTSIVSSITMETMRPTPTIQSTVALPEAFSETLDDDVPPWVKAAMHMIEQYQKNKDFVPPVDPMTMLPTSSAPSQPIQSLGIPTADPSVAGETAIDQIQSKSSPPAPSNTCLQDAPKAPKRSESFSSSSKSESSSYSSCSSDSDEERVTKSTGTNLVCKLPVEASVEKSVLTQSDVDMSISGKKNAEVTLNSDEVGESHLQDQLRTTRLDLDEEGIVSKIDQLKKKRDQNPTLLETTAPTISRTKSVDQELLEALGRSVDFSIRSKTPQRGIIPIEKCVGPKISLHSSALYKRDTTPCRGTQSRNNSGNQTNDNPLGTVSGTNDKDRFREQRRLAKKAANEAVSLDDDKIGVEAVVEQSKSSTRRGGTTNASFRNHSNSNIVTQPPMATNQLSEDQKGKDISNEVSVENASPSRKDRKGSIQFRNLRRLAKRAANEPLSDDEDTIIVDDVGITVEKDMRESSHKNNDNEKNADEAAPLPVLPVPVRHSILRTKSKTLENIPSLQQRKEKLFDK